MIILVRVTLLLDGNADIGLVCAMLCKIVLCTLRVHLIITA